MMKIKINFLLKKNLYKQNSVAKEKDSMTAYKLPIGKIP